MANWASTSYAIEGPKETLQRIEEAILHHPVEKDSSDNWEGNILKALDIEWEPHHMEQEGNNIEFSGYYMRGFIQEEPWWDERHDSLRFDAMEAWGATDFHEVLEKNIPDIKVFYVVEESGEEVYATNDKEGKYFKDRFFVDTCIDGNYQSEYFTYESSVYKWLHDITNGRVNSREEAEKFNADYEDSDAGDENYISIHEFSVIE